MRVEVAHEDTLESDLGGGYIRLEARARQEHLSYLCVQQGGGLMSVSLSLNLKELREVYEMFGTEIYRISEGLPEDVLGEHEESWMDKLKG